MKEERQSPKRNYIWVILFLVIIGVAGLFWKYSSTPSEPDIEVVSVSYNPLSDLLTVKIKNTGGYSFTNVYVELFMYWGEYILVEEFPKGKVLECYWIGPPSIISTLVEEKRYPVEWEFGFNANIKRQGNEEIFSKVIEFKIEEKNIVF